MAEAELNVSLTADDGGTLAAMNRAAEGRFKRALKDWVSAEQLASAARKVSAAMDDMARISERTMLSCLDSIAPREEGSTKTRRLTLGGWECPTSLLSICVYDMDAEWGEDDCLYCHQPKERK